LLTVLALFLLLSALLARAQETPPATDEGGVQILTGSLELGTEAFYLLAYAVGGLLAYLLFLW
jgi:hypothetical protein